MVRKIFVIIYEAYKNLKKTTRNQHETHTTNTEHFFFGSETRSLQITVFYTGDGFSVSFLKGSLNFHFRGFLSRYL